MIILEFIRKKDNPPCFDITQQIDAVVPPGFTGICSIAIQHTTVAVFLYEGKDQKSKEDLLNFLDKLDPGSEFFNHARGFEVSKRDSFSHIKAALLGFTLIIPCSGGKLVLGKWQRIFLCDFKTDRVRKLTISFAEDIQHSSYKDMRKL